MNSLSKVWEEGGAFMLPTLLTGLTALAFAMAASVSRIRFLMVAAVGLILTSTCVAAAGALWSRAKLEEALSVSPDTWHAGLREQANRESMRCLQLGGALCIVCLPMVFLAFRRSQSKTQTS